MDIHDLMKSLQESNDGKIVLLVADGIGKSRLQTSDNQNRNDTSVKNYPRLDSNQCPTV
jgi:hypothetical protein